MAIKCRLCEFTSDTPTGIGAHEAAHVRHGEGRWLGPKENGSRRPIQATGKPIRSAEEWKEEARSEREHLQGRQQLATAGTDRLGRVKSRYSGTPCEICGRSDFKLQHQFDSHRNWHVRNNEATWLNGRNKGDDKRLVSTTDSKRVDVQIDSQLIEETVIDPVTADQLIDSLETTLATVKMILAMRGMPAAAILQVANNLPKLANLRNK